MSQRAIKILCIVLAILLVLAIAGLIVTVWRNKNGPVAIQYFAIDGHVGKVRAVREDGVKRYIITITLPADTEFTRCTADIQLADGAYVSKQSPCYIDEKDGKPILNLTFENRDLIVVNGDKSRNYGFKIDLEKER